MPNQHTRASNESAPLNMQFHKWFYSIPNRQRYDESSDMYKGMKLAWEAAQLYLKASVGSSKFDWTARS